MRLSYLRAPHVLLALASLVFAAHASAEFSSCNGPPSPAWQDQFNRAVTCLRTIPAVAPIVDQVAAAGWPVCYVRPHTNSTTGSPHENLSDESTWWDPTDFHATGGYGTDGVWVPDGTVNNPEATLAHELCHAADNINHFTSTGGTGSGVYANPDEDVFVDPCTRQPKSQRQGGVPLSELNAVENCENLVREAKAGFATLPNGTFIDCPNGENPSVPANQHLLPRSKISGRDLCLCGNNKRDAGDQCDGTDDAACPGHCFPAGTDQQCQCGYCPPFAPDPSVPTCGNGVLDAHYDSASGAWVGEECDPTDYRYHHITSYDPIFEISFWYPPGQQCVDQMCQSDCTCLHRPDLPTCGNGVLDPGEVCDSIPIIREDSLRNQLDFCPDQQQVSFEPVCPDCAPALAGLVGCPLVNDVYTTITAERIPLFCLECKKCVSHTTRPVAMADTPTGIVPLGGTCLLSPIDPSNCTMHTLPPTTTSTATTLP
jgi:hypothetical protein